MQTKKKKTKFICYLIYVRAALIQKKSKQTKKQREILGDANEGCEKRKFQVIYTKRNQLTCSTNSSFSMLTMVLTHSTQDRETDVVSLKK